MSICQLSNNCTQVTLQGDGIGSGTISLNSFVSSAKEAILKFRQTNSQRTVDIVARTSPDEHLKFLQVKMDLSQAQISLWQAC